MNAIGKVRRFGSKFQKKTVKTVEDNSGVNEKTFREVVLAIKGGEPLESAVEFDEATKAKHFEIGRNYNAYTSRQENRLAADLTLKLKLKWMAINALPDSLLEEAMEETDLEMPMGRRIATLTPPVPEYAIQEESEFK